MTKIKKTTFKHELLETPCPKFMENLLASADNFDGLFKPIHCRFVKDENGNVRIKVIDEVK
jgi:hypothetical protein